MHTRQHGRRARLWRLSPAGRQSVGTAALVPVVVAAGSSESPWSGITERIPNFWGWVILLVLVAAVVGLAWDGARRFQRRTRRQRVMSLRWRLWLRRHPGPGFARLPELLRTFGLRSARKEAKRLFPASAARGRLSAKQSAILLGRMPSFPFRLVWVGPEENVLYVALPRSGKSGQIANKVLDAPGAVVATSTRADLAELTAKLRSRTGPVWVFDPQGVLGDRSPWPLIYWSPVNGCADPAIAMFRARSMLRATGSNSGVTNADFWDKASARALRALLHAAALGDYTALDIGHWVATNSYKPVEILRDVYPDQAAEGWAEQLQAIIDLGHKAEATQASLGQALGNVLDWLAHPGLAATCGGRGRGAGFDVESFLEDNGTLYMLAAPGADGELVAPVFTPLAEEIHARSIAHAQRKGMKRLDPPLSMPLDEIKTICPVPLPEWSATSAGHGIWLFPAVQSLAQLRERWGQDGAEEIFNNMSTVVVWGGVRSEKDRDEFSALAGQADFWYEPVHVSRDYDGNRHHDRQREWRREPIIRPEDLRLLPRRYALVVSRTAAPTIVRTSGAWLRRPVRAALKHPVPGRYERAQAPKPVVQDQPATGYVQRRPADAPDLPIGGDTAPQPVAAPGPEATDAAAASSTSGPAQSGDDQSMTLSDDDLARLLAGEDTSNGAQNGPGAGQGPALGHGWGPPPSGGGGLPEPPWGRRESYPWERRDGDA